MTHTVATRVAELNRLGAQAGNAGCFAQAIGCFREAIALAPSSPELRANLGAALCRSGQVEQGMRELRLGARLGPGITHALAALAREARAAHGEDGVIAELEALIADGHDGAELRCRLVQSLTRVGRSTDAAAHAEAALECDPRGVATPVRLARIASSVSSHDTAVTLYTRAHRLAPDDEEIAGALADSLIELGELARAAQILDRAAAEPAARLRLARARLGVERQQLDAARADLEAAHRVLFPRAAIVHVRRDPADVALSTYFARFGPRTGNLAYHARWSWIAHQLGAYERLMAHWRGLLADAWFELDYERLAAQPQAVTAELADFLGLRPAPQMPAALTGKRWVHTASTSQLGDAIHDRSVGRWRRYEAMLPGEIRALAR